jgi:riboflavin biosynthesis pyrimidine reductase
MAVLRALADAVLVGAGTVRAEGRRATWTPEFVFPAGAEAFKTLRRSLKRDATPRLVVVTATGDLDPSQRALEAGALVLTTAHGARRLGNSLPAATEVRAISDRDRIEVGEIFGQLERDGLRTILTEGGPRLFGDLVAANRVDELYLTVSPVIVGQKSDRSFGLIHGVEFGRTPRKSRLLSARLHGSHLFLRYHLERAA